MHNKPALPRLAITVGEPAGIGPEIALRAAWALRHEVRTVLIGDAALLAMLADEISRFDQAADGTPLVDEAIHLSAVSAMALRNGGLPEFNDLRLTVLDCPLAEPVVAGHLDARNGRSVLQTLDLALEGIAAGWFSGMVTAPLQKSVINQAGVAFSGHTEYLAEKTATAQVVMMLAGPRMAGPRMAGPQAIDGSMLRVALATTHLPLAAVSQAITHDGLLTTLAIIEGDLQRYFGLAKPRILVTGLNPHAGENGYLGCEEIDVITPALQAAQAKGMAVRGPFPADTLFQPHYLRDADCVLAMYHDQGLPVLKYATFGQGVNITLGLPLVRTSVDHGTALDLAARGLGLADDGSMRQAIRIAAQMVQSAAAQMVQSAAAQKAQS
jgi:4-hydroxythreonine-4-phosphate dehydrogenase